MRKLLPAAVMIGVLVLGGMFYGVFNPAGGTENPGQAPLPGSDTVISGERISVFSNLIGNITVNSSIIPESPRDIRIYRGYFREGDLVENITGPLMREVHNPIPKNQALVNAKATIQPAL